ncbi:MAG: hypothetical protein WC091_19775, partial [Sulfuricellaceae bacterium]
CRRAAVLEGVAVSFETLEDHIALSAGFWATAVNTPFFGVKGRSHARQTVDKYANHSRAKYKQD